MQTCFTGTRQILYKGDKTDRRPNYLNHFSIVSVSFSRTQYVVCFIKRRLSFKKKKPVLFDVCCSKKIITILFLF